MTHPKITSTKDIYATPRTVTDLDQCWFYHTMDLPGYGLVEGDWDLRQGIDRYLGGFDFQGKRVLDVGAASGFLTFHMERQGAKVVSYDLDETYLSDQDLAPTRYDYRQFMPEYSRFIKTLNNAYWLSHRAFCSQAKMVYGTVYAIPPEIGAVDVAIFGAILLHLRDPFLALRNALRLTRETAIVVEPFPAMHVRSLLIQRLKAWILTRFGKPSMQFLTEFWQDKPEITWWFLSPKIVVRFLAALGFADCTISYHLQPQNGVNRALFTVIGRRTDSAQLLGQPPTSANPSLLRAKLAVNELPTSLKPDQEIAVQATAQNVGDTLWLSAPQKSGGQATFGLKLYQADGQLVNDALGRTPIAHDVPPESQVDVKTSFRLPKTLAPGDYLMRFDMVAEQIAWFEQYGSPVLEHRFSVRKD